MMYILIIGGSNIKDGKDMVEFLATKSAADIVKHSGERFGPVVDGVFLTDHPWALYRSGQFNPVEVIVGYNVDDGLLLVGDIMKPNPDQLLTAVTARQVLKKILTRWFAN